MGKVLTIYCPVCKKRVVPDWETEDPYYDDPELAHWVPVCPFCGLQLTKNVIDSVTEEGESRWQVVKHVNGQKESGA